MGITTNLMIIFLVISILLSLANPSEWGSPLSEFLVTVNSETGEINYAGFEGKVLALLAVAGVVGISAGLFKGDITYGLFSAFLIFMVGFAIVPLNFFVNEDIPFLIKSVVGLPLSIMFLMGLIGWFRGSEL